MIGQRKTFAYPKEFITLPEYTAHAGQQVTVMRQLTVEEADHDVGPMYEVRTDDGWVGYAFEGELQ